MPPRSVAARVLSVLDAVERASGPLQVTQIAARTGLPVATAWRMVRELTEWGGLEQQADGRYRLATRVWAIGSSAPCVRRIQRDTSRHIRELAAATGRTAYLSVLDQDEALVVSLAHAGRGTPEVHEGSRLRADASSAGLLFSAFDGPDGNPVRDGRIAVHRDITGRSSMSAAITDKAGAVVAALTLTGGRGEAWQRLRPTLVDAARTVRFSIYRDELLA
ncbi:IclR family transcriptional regulator [Amycolatopsis thermoflava]|uniref:DNA-binding IclR family transcriptional regulator n=1 Tax=Amycolatopsis thermoflava TaxID=84480 RepID=A0A3N2H5P8_9PSEU|nr:helix-turn-helix domain-containing protein [Amycolatopsis thermoflava]ROS44216.1 DNA-binding IclR family transcriptional regulator [Amycolatopsis thermoflava]